MILEPVQHRVLAAFRFTDAVTDLPVPFPVQFQVDAVEQWEPGVTPSRTNARAGSPNAVRFLRNRSGFHVLTTAPLLESYTTQFDAPVRPDALAGQRFLRLVLRVTDPGPNHLPRLFRLDLPRPLTPTSPDAVFRPIDVSLLPAPAAPMSPTWARIRILVTRLDTTGRDTGIGVGGVLIEAHRDSDGTQVGRAMTEWRRRGLHEARGRGEALLTLRGIRPFVPSTVANPGSQPMDDGERIRLTAVRDAEFTEDDAAAPDLASLEARTAAQIVVALPASFVTTPAQPVRLRPGSAITLRASIR